MRLDTELRQRLAEAVCPGCPETGAFAIVGLDYPHFGRVICAHSAAPLIEAIKDPMRTSGHFLEWLEGPKEQPRVRRRTKMRRVDSVRERCEICLRGGNELTDPVKLRAHHVHEVHQGGDDSDENRRVYCDDCHRLVHWVRRTLGREDEDTEYKNDEAGAHFEDASPTW
jgi:hypothetical protein